MIWFVAPNGLETNPGTLDSPFHTIQHAADVAQAGDHVEIRAGTYRETITPAHSGTPVAPIVFEAYNMEIATISGADPVSGWSVYQGAIYQCALPWTIGEGKDQVFVDSQMINTARFPNTNLDVSHPTLAHAARITVSETTAILDDPALTQRAGFWAGATIRITPGQGWVAQTGTVLSSSPGQLRYKFIPLDKYHVPTAGNPYYLTGTLNALDAPGEWHRDAAGNLFLHAPASDNPTSHAVEAKHRAYAFDVSGRSNITIQGVHLFAATINSDHDSVNLVVNHINARYTGQFLLLPQGWDLRDRAGIVLAGANSVIQNSIIAFSAGDGVLVKGADCRVSNNLIHDVDYAAADCAAIRVFGVGCSIDRNTIYNTGRSGILHTAARLKILYNIVHDAGLQTTDAGGIYTVDTDGQGTEIAWNQIYNMHSGGYGQTGLFFDNNSNNYLVHHNQVYNVDHALKLNFICHNNDFHNNTLEGTETSVYGNNKGDWNGTRLTHNLLPQKTVFATGSVATANSTVPAPGIGAGSFAAGADPSISDRAPAASQPAK